MKYTFYGDANLDGQVNGTDYTAIDNDQLRTDRLEQRRF